MITPNVEQLEAHWRDFQTLWNNVYLPALRESVPSLTENDVLSYKMTAWRSHLIAELSANC
jgi:hypothetical protein